MFAVRLAVMFMGIFLSFRSLGAWCGTGDAAIHPKPERKSKSPRKMRRLKTPFLMRICMFSANDSWLSSFIPGRSSDLAIMAFAPSSRRISPSDMLALGSRLTATSSCRICTCFPFHPGAKPYGLPRTPRTLYVLGCMIAHGRLIVKGRRRAKSGAFFKKPFTKTGKKGIIFRYMVKRA